MAAVSTKLTFRKYTQPLMINVLTKLQDSGWHTTSFIVKVSINEIRNTCLSEPVLKRSLQS